MRASNPIANRNHTKVASAASRRVVSLLSRWNTTRSKINNTVTNAETATQCHGVTSGTAAAGGGAATPLRAANNRGRRETVSKRGVRWGGKGASAAAQRRAREHHRNMPPEHQPPQDLGNGCPLVSCFDSAGNPIGDR